MNKGWEGPGFAVERPKKNDFGHASSNVALTLAKQLRKRPLDIAEEIAGELNGKIEGLEKIEIAAPGFLNFFFLPAYFQSFIPRIRSEKEAFQKTHAGKNQTVQVEFVSANPTGPLTIGHGRQAVLGDTVSRILEWHDFEVTREYYFNDAGRQMRMLGLSVLARYNELLGKELSIPEGGYEGEYIIDIADAFRKSYGDHKTEEDLELFIEFASQSIFISIRETLKRLDIEHDVYYNEKDLYKSGKIKEVLDLLEKEGHI
ncbi:MAG: arginine--tRNA ligase [Candidatus Marinimicrobia bacterium]|nr:arginine--tRNA ligase [Candidatus Neomarinimicrobiota bacterium]